MSKVLEYLIVISVVVALCGAAQLLSSPTPPWSGPMQPEPPQDCVNCHECAHPTSVDPCLRPCSRGKLAEFDPMIGPDTCVLDDLENEYAPVIFGHRLHAEMSPMGQGCTNCHHYSDPGEITACKNCHPIGISHENLRQPGLKGAYHRQCMGCHTDWSGTTQCDLCHAKIEAGAPKPVVDAEHPPRPGRITAKFEAPEKKTWESSYGGGTIVTLHHKSHTETYGIPCAACHHAEGCAFCHSEEARSQPVRHSEQALHAICVTCHEETSCEQCHMKEEAVEFSHERTGWPIAVYHSSLACRDCHGSPYHFTKPSPKCDSCHPAFTSGEFDHGRTGLVLDENHAVLDCDTCHEGDAYAVAPAACDNCHDGEYRYPENLPGTRVGRHFAAFAEPDTKVWESAYGGGTVVTLHHRNHTERYGIDCAACHHAEGCAVCHEAGKTTRVVRHSEEALHGICNRCHEEMSCDQCHLDAQAEEFSHDRTGWPLKSYHASTPCRDCHGNPDHFTKPSPECAACHAGWAVGAFDHAKTGLALSEKHLELECNACHVGDSYLVAPEGCDKCHEGKIRYPKSLPGTPVSETGR